MERSRSLQAVLSIIATGLVTAWAGSARTEPVNGQLEPGAGEWRTWAISGGGAIAVPAPPDAGASAQEIRDLKPRLAHDTGGADRVAYWDRAWPGYRWQEIALEESQKDPKPFLWRTMALVSVAIHDATVATWHAKYEYSRSRPSEVDPTIKPIVAVPQSPSYPSEHAAVAAAAADVLGYVFPSSAAVLQRQAEEAARSRVEAGVQYPSDVEAGLALGHRVGAAVIAHGKADRSEIPWDGQIKTGPGLWAGTNPRLITMGSWTPWVLESADQFRPPPPPAPGSAQMAADLAEIKGFPRTLVTRRTSWFWAAIPELREWVAVPEPSAQTFPQAFTPPMTVLSEGHATRDALSTGWSARAG